MSFYADVQLTFTISISALLRDLTQRRMTVSYQGFGTIYLPHPQGRNLGITYFAVFFNRKFLLI